MRSAPLRPRSIVSGCLAATLILAGCSSGSVEEEPNDVTSVVLHPMPGPDLWLHDDYEHGFGDTWQPDNSRARICGIEDDVVVLSDASGLSAVHLGDGGQIWQLPDSGCQPYHVVDGFVYTTVVTDDPELQERWQRIEIATGQRSILTEPGAWGGRSTPIAHRDDVSYLVLGRGEATLRAVGDTGVLWQIALPDFERCRLLDGGTDTAGDVMPEGARFGCWNDNTFRLIEPATGEVRAEVELGSSNSGVHILAARDGYIEIPKNPPEGIEHLEQFDLDGNPSGTNTVTNYPRVPDTVTVTLADLQTTTDVQAYTVAADGSVVTTRPEYGRVVLANGQEVPMWASERFVTASGGAIIVSPDRGDELLLLDARDGTERGRIDAKWHELEVMGGYLVFPGREGGGRVFLPAAP